MSNLLKSLGLDVTVWDEEYADGSDSGLCYDPWVMPARLHQRRVTPSPTATTRTATTARVYMPPQNQQAWEIWRECAFSMKGEPVNRIKAGLQRWCEDREIETRVCWKSGNTSYSVPRPTFIKWFLCTCPTHV